MTTTEGGGGGGIGPQYSERVAYVLGAYVLLKNGFQRDAIATVLPQTPFHVRGPSLFTPFCRQLDMIATAQHRRLFRLFFPPRCHSVVFSFFYVAFYVALALAALA